MEKLLIREGDKGSMNREDLIRINKKMMMAGSDREAFDGSPRREREQQYTGGKNKYRKIFETPTSYKEYDKETVKKCLEKDLTSILRDFEQSYKSGNYPDSLRFVLGNKRFIKTLKKNLDKFEDKTLIGFMLSEQLLKNKFVYSDEEIKSSYEETFLCSLAKKFQKFMDKFELDEKVAKELFINVCLYEDIRPAHIHQRVLNILSILYNRIDDYNMDAITIFKKLFREYQFDALIGILLEPRENQNCLSPKAKELWSRFTNLVLDEVEQMEKDDIKKFMQIYMRCLKSVRKHGERLPRVSLLNNISGDYENINKIVRKIIDRDESDKKYFM